jgi:hypothetical protein
MLLLPAINVSYGIGRVTHSQAHGVAQLFGWSGLFVMGVAYHVVPRFRNAPMPVPWPQRLTLALVITGIVLRFFGQTLRSPDVSPALLVASGISLLAGVAIFSVMIAQALYRGTAARSSAEPWIWAGCVWAVVAASLHLIIVIDMADDRVFIARAFMNKAFIYAAIVGFLGNFILGVSARSVSAFMALNPPRQRVRRLAFWAVNLGLAWQVTMWAAGAQGAWIAPGMLSMALGFFAVVYSLRIFERRAQSRFYIPGTYGRYEWYLRASHGWLLVAGAFLFLEGVGFARGEAILPVLMASPILHVLALGFVSMIVMGMASRMVPLFEGAQLPNGGFMDIAFAFLNLSVLLRLVFGIAALGMTDIGLAASGIFGLLAVMIFTWPMWNVLRPAARETYRQTVRVLASNQQTIIGKDEIQWSQKSARPRGTQMQLDIKPKGQVSDREDSSQDTGAPSGGDDSQDSSGEEGVPPGQEQP